MTHRQADISALGTAATFLIGLGAQKAGTTWLYAYLRDHPDAHVPACKEMNYFDVLYRPKHNMTLGRRERELARQERSPRHRITTWINTKRTLFVPNAVPPVDLRSLRELVEMNTTADPTHSRYRTALLRGYRGQRCVADISPDYSWLKAPDFRKIAADFPNAKFLYLLRDPVRRSWSDLCMYYQVHGRSSGLEFGDLLDIFVGGEKKHVIRRSRYDQVLAEIEAAVPEDRRLFVFYEDLFADAAVKKICDFAGIAFRSGQYERKVNQSALGSPIRRDVEQMLITQLEPVYTDMVARFGDALPTEWQKVH